MIFLKYIFHYYSELWQNGWCHTELAEIDCDADVDLVRRAISALRLLCFRIKFHVHKLIFPPLYRSPAAFNQFVQAAVLLSQSVNGSLYSCNISHWFKKQSAQIPKPISFQVIIKQRVGPQRKEHIQIQWSGWNKSKQFCKYDYFWAPGGNGVSEVIKY